MKLLKGYVDWNERFQNFPEVVVLVDSFPFDDIRYRREGNLYFGEYQGVCSIFARSYCQYGFGGSPISVIMEDGSKEVFHAFSSNESVIYRVFGVPCMQVSLTTDPKVLKRGYTFCSASLTVDFLLRHRELIHIPNYKQEGNEVDLSDAFFDVYVVGDCFVPFAAFGDGRCYTKEEGWVPSEVLRRAVGKDSKLDMIASDVSGEQLQIMRALDNVLDK